MGAALTDELLLVGLGSKLFLSREDDLALLDRKLGKQMKITIEIGYNLSSLKYLM